MNEQPKDPQTPKEPFMRIALGASTVMPEFVEVKNKSWLYFGKDNRFPEQTLRIFRDSSDHRAIVKGKTRFILGNGIEMAEGKTAPEILIQANQTEAFADVLAKATLDWELHRGFALKVRWNRVQQISRITHIPFQRIRAKADGREFYVCKKWGDRKEEEKKETYPSMELSRKKKDCIYYFVDYDPSSEVYPLPDYVAAMPYMNIDTQIANFHDSNVSSGFTAGTMMTLFRGEPPAEEKAELSKKIKNRSTGSDNGGELLLYFADEDEKPPQIDPLRSNELDKQYMQLSETVQQKIFTAHNVTNPMLFGIKTSGQLGGRTELLESWELMDKTYIQPQQETIIKAITTMLKLGGIETDFNFKRIQPISEDILPLFQAGLMSKQTAQEMKSLPIDEVKVQGGGNELNDAINGLSPLVANKVLEALTPDEVRGMVGMGPAPIKTEPIPAPETAKVPEVVQAPENIKMSSQEPPEAIVEPVVETITETVIKFVELPAPQKLPGKLKLWKAKVGNHTHAPILGETPEGANEYLQKSGLLYVKLTGEEETTEALTDTEVKLWNDDSDLAVFEQHGELESDYDILETHTVKFATDISEVESKALRTIAGSPKASLTEIGKVLWITTKETAEVVGKLVEKKLIEPASGGGMTITPTGQILIDQAGPNNVLITTKYRYQGPKDDKNRPFCARLMGMGRIYDRSEIDTMSAQLGYDVWKRRGGWYRVPGSDPALNIPHCRHQWEQVIVRRKLS